MATYKYKRGGRGSLYVPGEKIPCTHSKCQRHKNKEKIMCNKSCTINETNLFVQIVQTSF